MRRGKEEGVSKVWVGQNTDFHSWERKELPCKQAREGGRDRKEPGERQVKGD